MLDAASGGYRPHQVVALAAPGDETAAENIPLLANRPQQKGQATAYVCQQFVCQIPTTDPTALEAQLSRNK